MNLNELAVKITEKEGKQSQTNIAQVKEIVSVLGQILSELSWLEAMILANKIRKSGRN